MSFDYYTYDDIRLTYDQSDMTYEDAEAPNASEIPDFMFLLLLLDQTDYGDVYSLSTWARAFIQLIGDDSGDVIEVYVSNDGTNFVLRGTVSGPDGQLNIQGPYKAIKVKHVSGTTRVVATCNRDYEL